MAGTRRKQSGEIPRRSGYMGLVSADSSNLKLFPL